MKEFADHIQCDPELAQELYFEHKVSEALDNEQKASMGRELSTLQIVSNNLDRAAKACKPFGDAFKFHMFDWLLFPRPNLHWVGAEQEALYIGKVPC